MISKGRSSYFVIFSLISCMTANAYAYQPFNLTSLFCSKQHVVLDLGLFSAYQGKAQHVDIDGLIGDQFSVTQHNDQKGLVGLGYYFECKQCDYTLWYGIHAFYLAPAAVKGKVTQENLFTNLSYEYSITNMPIYLATKGIFNFNTLAYPVTFTGGVGINFLQTNDFNESSLDGGQTLPDVIFSGETKTVFSAMLGVGLQFEKLIHCMPIELGYRFFYLGEGHIKGNSQASNINTGTGFANALIISASIL